MRKPWRLFAILTVFLLIAAACGDDDDAGTTTAAPTDDTSAQATTTVAPAEVPGLKEPGKLILVTTGNFPPFTLINADTGDNEGYSIDIGREVAERLGLELELPTVDFVAELQGLADGLYDIADSGIWPNQDRQDAGFVFTRPMTSTGIVAQVRAEDAGTQGLADMTDKNVGGIQGSSQEAYVVNCVEEFGCASYTGFAGAAEALTALRQGRVDMLSQDTLVAGFAAVTFDDLAVAGPTVLAHPLSMTFREGNEALRDAIDPVLDAMIADGALAEIQKKWFGTCIPVPDDINSPEPYTTLPAGDC